LRECDRTQPSLANETAEMSNRTGVLAANKERQEREGRDSISSPAGNDSHT